MRKGLVSRTWVTKDYMNNDSKEVVYSQIDLLISDKYDISREDNKSKWKSVYHCTHAQLICFCNNVSSILVPRTTILLTCGRDRELWLCPTPEVRDSRTSRQIWQIWLAENMKRRLCTCSENRVRPELSIRAAGQKDRGSGDENVFPRFATGAAKHSTTKPSNKWFVEQLNSFASELCNYNLGHKGLDTCFCCRFFTWKLRENNNLQLQK